MPRLVAALRAVEALCDRADAAQSPDEDGVAWGYWIDNATIRTAIRDALEAPVTAHDDAVKTAAEALSEYYEGDGWGYFDGAAEAAVAAAAPILLAAERAEVERLNRVIAAYEEDADVALVEMAEAVEAESQAADRAIARKDAEIERLQAALALQAESVEAASTREDHIKAAERARIAAAIRAAGHPDGYHRVDTTREWAGIYCADCAVTERSARIAETAPEDES